MPLAAPEFDVSLRTRKPGVHVAHCGAGVAWVAALMALAAGSGVLLALTPSRPELGYAAWFIVAPVLLAQRVLPAWRGALVTAVWAASLYLVQGRAYAPISTSGAVVVPLVIGVIYGGAWVLARRALGSWASAAVVGASLWFGVERLVSALGVETGALGYTQAGVPATRVAAAAVGAEGLSWLIWFANAVAAGGVHELMTRRRAASRTVIRTAAGAGAVALCVWAAGIPRPLEETGSLRAVIVPGHFSLKERDRARLDPDARTAMLEYYFDTARAATDETDEPTLVVFPETALSSWAQRDWWLAQVFERRPFPPQTAVMIGGYGGQATQREFGFNSAFVFDAAGALVDRYDKVRLIPFDERQPLQHFPMFIDRTKVMEFSPGEPRPPIALPADVGDGATLGVNICYEEGFAEGTHRQVNGGAALLVTIANYSYFPDPSAPGWLRATGVMRAVETGRWMLRCCNRGPSHVIDPQGREVGAIGFNDQDPGSEDPALVRRVRLVKGRTLYTSVGYAGVRAGAAAILVLAFIGTRAAAPRGGIAGPV